MISSEVVLLASATPVLSPRLVSRSHDGNLPVTVTVNVYIRVRVRTLPPHQPLSISPYYLNNLFELPNGIISKAPR